MRASTSGSTRLLVCATVLTLSVRSQCALQWLPSAPYAGASDGITAATRWDPDGPGPAGESLVVAGWFHVLGAVRANSVAAYDPVTGRWTALGDGTNGPVHALLALPNGDLVVGGQFSVAGGVAASQIARWNGGAWAPIGAGLPVGASGFGVRALASLPNGDLVAGGGFPAPGGTQSIARWNGSAWSALGGGVGGSSQASVFALCIRTSGDLIAGGQFTSAGGAAAANIAQWNGATWSPLAAGVDGSVLALRELPNGELAVGGQFDNAGGAPAQRIATWNGSAWAPLGGGLTAALGQGVLAFTTLPNGDLVAGGVFASAGGGVANGIARWNGVTWSGLGTGFGPANSGPAALATLPNGDLVAGGGFASAGGALARNLARWDGATWSSFVAGSDGYLTAIALLPNGDLVVGGSFATIDGVAANNIARRSAGVWQALGTGTDGLVGAVAVLPNGDIVAGGQFEHAGGTAVARIARWNGSTWSPLGGGVGGTFQPEVWALLPLPNGDLIVGGTFTTAGGTSAHRVARWNGVAWAALGAGVDQPGSVYVTVGALAAMPNGDLIAAGDFTLAGGAAANRIARWNGAAWSSLGTGVTVPLLTLYAQVRSVLVLPNGDLVVAGNYQSPLGNGLLLQRWNGAAWSPLGSPLTAGPSPLASGLAMLPDGDLVVGLSRVGLPGNTVTNSLARLHGSSWTSLGDDFDRGIAAVVLQPDGTLEVAGGFAAIGDLVSPGLARLVSTCPGAVAALGPGCSGAGGPNLLVADPPWIGGTFRSWASGLAPGSLAASVYGFTPIALPMPTVHPLGQPGCTLWVDDDILLSFSRTGGSLASELAVPANAMLIGAAFHHQVVPVEIDAVGNLLALTGTNALTLTIGSF